MVNAHPGSTAADLILIAAALHHAVTHNTVLGCVLGIKLRATETLARVLQTSVGEALGLAEVDALLDCVVAAAVGGAGEGAVGDVVFPAADVLPVLGECDVGVVDVAGAKGDAIVALLRRGAVWAVCDWVAAGEFVEEAIVDFVDELGELAVLGLLAGELCQWSTTLN